MIVIQLWFTNLDSPEILRDCLHQLILNLLGDEWRVKCPHHDLGGSLVIWTVRPCSFPIINHQPRPSIDYCNCACEYVYNMFTYDETPLFQHIFKERNSASRNVIIWNLLIPNPKFRTFSPLALHEKQWETIRNMNWISSNPAQFSWPSPFVLQPAPVRQHRQAPALV